ncbi:hypothetical protein AGDE_12519 [Angomonas deanei]|uniref:RNA recognition motif. (A.k.a. RRM, RBD, or RNP domain), putative n=1 Tax=Angomonas deanei TaxID=59799 RepID=A0A7G2CCG0_9TRYP|nr:hypothetical protein AGDE_12519 [Angomonas deanei]CAD2217125.1 RNA recognition motif. (a.k.a. RRM, RBD, or RNP domain), putative [Angomonas deanei]|eukprot:EPY24085.1 hypothetical protein AGDE_12519 [Angomonas deanei]
MVEIIYINGQSYDLLDDYRFQLSAYFDERAVLLDPAYTPPRPVPLGTGEDEGITVGKLQPYAHYQVRRETNGVLQPYSTYAECIYVTGIPYNATHQHLHRYFTSFGLVESLELFKNRGRARVRLAEKYRHSGIPGLLEYNGTILHIHHTDKVLKLSSEHAMRAPPRYPGQDEMGAPTRMMQRTYGKGPEHPSKRMHTPPYEAHAALRQENNDMGREGPPANDRDLPPQRQHLNPNYLGRRPLQNYPPFQGEAPRRPGQRLPPPPHATGPPQIPIPSPASKRTPHHHHHYNPAPRGQ